MPSQHPLFVALDFSFFVYQHPAFGLGQRPDPGTRSSVEWAKLLTQCRHSDYDARVFMNPVLSVNDTPSVQPADLIGELAARGIHVDSRTTKVVAATSLACAPLYLRQAALAGGTGKADVLQIASFSGLAPVPTGVSRKLTLSVGSWLTLAAHYVNDAHVVLPSWLRLTMDPLHWPIEALEAGLFSGNGTLRGAEFSEYTGFAEPRTADFVLVSKSVTCVPPWLDWEFGNFVRTSFSAPDEVAEGPAPTACRPWTEPYGIGTGDQPPSQDYREIHVTDPDGIVIQVDPEIIGGNG